MSVIHPPAHGMGSSTAGTHTCTALGFHRRASPRSMGSHWGQFEAEPHVVPICDYEDPRLHGMGMCGSHTIVPVFTEILQESFDPSGVTPVTVQ